MSHFNRDGAMLVLQKLEAEIMNSRGIMGLVPLDQTFRLRFCFPPGDEAPSYVKHRWRQTLRLTVPEFDKLLNCTMSGPESLELCRGRIDL